MEEESLYKGKRIALNDSNGQIIVVLEPEPDQDALKSAYRRIDAAYEAGRITEARHLQYLAALQVRGLSDETAEKIYLELEGRLITQFQDELTFGGLTRLLEQTAEDSD
tara:strand:+ start:2414 stop:2740 length:327 start_codon:yes stop_codon:yes gene_type:complete